MNSRVQSLSETESFFVVLSGWGIFNIKFVQHLKTKEKYSAVMAAGRASQIYCSTQSCVNFVSFPVAWSFLLSLERPILLEKLRKYARTSHNTRQADKSAGFEISYEEKLGS